MHFKINARQASIIMVALFLIPNTTFATNMAFDQNSFAYVYFDYGINNILHGPLGIAVGILMFAGGALGAVSGSIWRPIGGILGGIAFINADSLVSTISGSLF